MPLQISIEIQKQILIMKWDIDIILHCPIPKLSLLRLKVKGSDTVGDLLESLDAVKDDSDDKKAPYYVMNTEYQNQRVRQV